MFAIGDYVVFRRDGTIGMIMDGKDSRYQVIWEDHFVSWEEESSLQKAVQPVKRNRLQEQAYPAK